MPSDTKYDAIYYVKGALSGGICTSITHAAVTPIDVVKTRNQQQPGRYPGMVSGLRTINAAEGSRALFTGLGATAVGYFVQGWFKFGGVEFFKINAAHALGPQKAWDNRTAIYLGASAAAEFIADLFLCPLEAVRIRSVGNAQFPQSLPAGFMHILKNEGPLRLYDGLGPLLFKQIPYTMAKFAVQGKAAEVMYSTMDKRPEDVKGALSVGVSLASGVVAGVVAAVISHPADTLLTKINKGGAGGAGGTITRLARIAKETGMAKLFFTGLGTRCVMVGALTAGQFGIFDSVMSLFGAERFHFHPPTK
jgi:solute carrier family 25 phosphate transporter 3